MHIQLWEKISYLIWIVVADKKWGKGKDKIDDEDITFQRMVAKVSESLILSFFLFF